MELFSPGHLLVLGIIVLVLFFGWKQLPDMARSLGRSLRIFKTEIKGMGEDDKKRAEAQIVEPKSIEAAPAPTVTTPAPTAAAPAPRPRPAPPSSGADSSTAV